MSDPLLHILIRGAGVPDGYRYTFPQDGFRVSSYNYSAWIDGIKNHYARNGYERPENWIALAEDQCCRLLPPGFCAYDTGELPQYFVDLRFTLDDALNGTKALFAWTVSGFPLVTKEVAEARAATCSACYARVDVPGCSTCAGFASLVAQVVGTEALPSDARLEGKVCAYCKCSLRAHVWIPKQVLRAGVSDEALEAMPDFCWKKSILLNNAGNSESAYPKRIALNTQQA
jgi:hypothetical protein